MLSPDERKRVWNTSLQQHLMDVFGLTSKQAEQAEQNLTSGIIQPMIHWTDLDRIVLRHLRIAAD